MTTKGTTPIRSAADKAVTKATGLTAEQVRGEIVRALRMKDGYSVAAFARECGVAPSHISNIEAGRRGANPALLKRMAYVLNVPMSVLEVRRAAA